MERMQQRVSDLMGRSFADPNRLEVELALLAEKSDVTEEIVRLESHLKKLEELAKHKGSVGRHLDFLVQEIHREVNTIGAKSGDIDITADVVFMKSEVEKVREQAQNLE